MRRIRLAVVVVVLIGSPKSVRSFAPVIATRRLVSLGHDCYEQQHPETGGESLYPGQDENTEEKQSPISSVMNHGLLISSFQQGLKPNALARKFLRKGLMDALRYDEKQNAEDNTDNDDFDSTTTVTTRTTKLNSRSRSRKKNTHHQLRFVYIPTAMYALRPNSNNTPGKQRQRARVDGKKRRNEIVRLLQEELLCHVAANKGAFEEENDDGYESDNSRMGRVNSSIVVDTILAVTLDLDDGSIKQPEGSNEKSLFPQNGKDALQRWKPHFLYVEGGNTFWLYHCIEKGNWADDIRNLLLPNELEQKTMEDNKKQRKTKATTRTVYCGSSAGAIVVGKSMDVACWKGFDDPSIVFGRETYNDWKDVEGLGLVGNTAFFPHMEDQWTNIIEQKCRAAAMRKPLMNVYTISDSEAYCIDGSFMSWTKVSAARTETPNIIVTNEWHDLG